MRFHDSITSFGFEMIEEDHYVYIKQTKKSIIILSLYIDDILLARNDMSAIVATREWLSSQFKVKDMGEANYVLGVKIMRDWSKKLLCLSQETYTKKLLERFHINNSKPIDKIIILRMKRKGDKCPTCHMHLQ